MNRHGIYQYTIEIKKDISNFFHMTGSNFQSHQ